MGNFCCYDKLTAVMNKYYDEKASEKIERYCKELVFIHFNGEASPLRVLGFILQNDKNEPDLLHRDEYWGTRQPLLSGKIVCDWLCEEDMPPMDPIFGVLLNPTGGLVGPGDSGFIHTMLFDNDYAMAHHAAVHDAFGYLINYHNIGPGYNYIRNSSLSNGNPLAGQFSGIFFWVNYLKEIREDLKNPDKIKYL